MKNPFSEKPNKQTLKNFTVYTGTNRSVFKYSKLSLSAFAVLFGGIGVYTLLQTKAAAGADLYVSSTGNDSSSCTQAQPCRTFNRAYQLSQPGYTVEVAPGTYPEQTIDAQSRYDNPTSADVIFRPVSGAVVNVEWITVFGYHLEFKDFTGEGWYVKPGAHHVTFRNLDVDNVFATSASYVNVLGGDIGPHLDGAAQFKNETSSARPQSHHLVIDGVLFHDYPRTPNAGVHTECLALWGWNDVTVKNSKFIRCAVMDIPITEAGFGNPASWGSKNITLENNFFSRPYNTLANNGNGADDGFSSLQIGGGPVTNLLVRNNTFETPVIFQDGTAITNARFVNNIGNWPNSSYCNDDVTYEYNVWSGVKCGATDKLDTSVLSQLVNKNAGDFHLTSDSPAINYSKPGDCPATDIDGNTRPSGAACDAGADEYIGSGGTTPPHSDTTAPTVSLTSPANNATVSGSNVTVSANASDNVGVVGVQFKLDGANINSEDTSSPYSVTWNSTSVSNGSHNLTAVARDTAGNTTTSSTRTINVNNTSSSSPATAMNKPLYRLYDHSTYRHFWTSDPAERDFVVSALKFKYEGVASYVSNNPGSGLTPLYRLYDHNTYRHFWTSDPAERDFVVSVLKFKYEGIASYVSNSPGTGLTPLYRLYDHNTYRHFWTSDPAERDFVVSVLKFKYEGIATYVKSAQ